MKSTNLWRHIKNSKSSGGFTLIEVTISIAILAILASMAAPSFTESVRKFRIASVRDELSGTIQLTRSEAIRRSTPILINRTTLCGATLIDANDWSCGWEIVVDTNRNGIKNVGEPILQTTVVPDGYGVMHTGLGPTLITNTWGQVQGVGQRFVVTPPEGVSGKSTTTLCMTSGGRIRKIIGDAVCP